MLTSAVIHRLASALERGEAAAVDGEIENVVDLAVGALIHGRAEDLETLHPAVERLYAAHRAAGSPNAQALITGQLRALTTLLSTAARRRRPLDARQLLNDAKYAPLVKALRDAGKPLTNQELAAKAGLSEETVARHMPVLRAGGFVTSVRAWKQKLNQLSPTAEAALRDARQLDQPAATSKRTARRRFSQAEPVNYRLVTAVARTTSAPTEVVNEVLNEAFINIMDSQKKRREVNLVGFGRFEVHVAPAKPGALPRRAR
jgi:DNA-binding transcriptional ArsR family regulator